VPTAVSLEDPVSVATELARVEAAIRSPATPAEQLPHLGRIQQLAYRKLVANPAWRPAALAHLPRDLVAVAQANIEAGAELTALTRPVTKLPAWRIVEPPPAEELRRYYAEAERQFGIPWAYLAAIHLVESRMGRIRGTSTAGAQGPMQFIPGTWARYGRGDINNPQDAILAAARYLRASGAPANMPAALYAYNRSQRYVRGITLYAQRMLENERAYLGYYHWQVFVRSTTGDVPLEVGYGS
jgi:membrane-bound lytic murein transglycosylase B